ncbi:MAG TPA: hypothetical protein VME47_16685 [Acetobacteraceae bacterium]|nr:hypothetical protein [Acetobacteraceae bacterium]
MQFADARLAGHHSIAEGKLLPVHAGAQLGVLRLQRAKPADVRAVGGADQVRQHVHLAELRFSHGRGHRVAIAGCEAVGDRVQLTSQSVSIMFCLGAGRALLCQSSGSAGQPAWHDRFVCRRPTDDDRIVDLDDATCDPLNHAEPICRRQRRLFQARLARAQSPQYNPHFLGIGLPAKQGSC